VNAQPEGKSLAEVVYKTLHEARIMGTEKRKSSAIVTLTCGEFLTYCHITPDSCVSMGMCQPAHTRPLITRHSPEPPFGLLADSHRLLEHYQLRKQSPGASFCYPVTTLAGYLPISPQRGQTPAFTNQPLKRNGFFFNSAQELEG
jgi:hypothetical protein